MVLALSLGSLPAQAGVLCERSERLRKAKGGRLVYCNTFLLHQLSAQCIGGSDPAVDIESVPTHRLHDHLRYIKAQAIPSRGKKHKVQCKSTAACGVWGKRQTDWQSFKH